MAKQEVETVANDGRVGTNPFGQTDDSTLRATVRHSAIVNNMKAMSGCKEISTSAMDLTSEPARKQLHTMLNNLPPSDEMTQKL